MMQTNNRPVGWGILGAARINRRLVPALQAARNATLIAVASRNSAQAQQSAAQWGALTAHTGYEALLSDPQVEVVYIPLPNSLHAEWTLRAIKAGKHVLCEKPLALTVQDVQLIAEASRQKGVLVMEGFMYRFHPQHARVSELLAQGRIGPPRLLRGTFAFPVARDTKNIRLDSGLAGGATWDVGCYALNVARWLFDGEPHSIFAQGSLENEVDMAVAAVVDFGAGRQAVLDFGLNYGRRFTYEIIGTSGSLSVENVMQEPDAPAYVYLREAEGLTTFEIEPANHFQLEVEAFSQAVRQGGPAPYALQDSQANAAACVALLRSLREGSPVGLEVEP